MITLFAIFDAFGAVPLFVALTGDLGEAERKSVVNRSIIVSLVILVTFAYLGVFLFQILGITLNDFKMIGGIILLIFSVSYVLGREAEGFMPRKGEEIAVFPLATPLLAGPGSISVVILMANPPYGPITTFLAIVFNIALAWLILRAGGYINNKLGKQGSSVLSRLMGLIIGAVAIKLIREALEEILPKLVA